MPDTPADEAPKCELTFCEKPAIGHYRWGTLPQQQGRLCQSCADMLWNMSNPDVRDRMSITPLHQEVAHA